MGVGQKRLGEAQELDGDQRRLCRCLSGGGAQPCHGLVVASLRPEHQVLGDGQVVRTSRHQRHRGLAVQETPGRRWHVPVDRVVHELVPEHDTLVGLVEQLGVERVAELGNHLGRRAARDSGDIAE